MTKLVTIYDADGKPVVRPTLLDVAKAAAPSDKIMLDIIQALATRDPFKQRTGLLDQYGKELYK